MRIEQNILVVLLSMILSVIIIMASSAYFSAELAKAESEKAVHTEETEDE